MKVAQGCGECCGGDGRRDWDVYLLEPQPCLPHPANPRRFQPRVSREKKYRMPS